jgi:hypothetical protein
MISSAGVPCCGHAILDVTSALIFGSGFGTAYPNTSAT